jgi:hypothetical protein
MMRDTDRCRGSTPAEGDRRAANRGRLAATLHVGLVLVVVALVGLAGAWSAATAAAAQDPVADCTLSAT